MSVERGMKLDYIKGVIFIALAILFLSSLGKLITKKDMFSKNILVGFVLYTTLQALIGIMVQMFRIDFLIYKLCMLVMVLVLVSILIYKGKKLFDFKNFLVKFKEHIKKYKLLYVLAGILFAFSVLNVTYLWLGNHQDDGLYLLKVALAPELGGNYDVNYASGFMEELALSRAINTFELDYAFWSDLFGIYPSVFCKAVMVFLNYFLVLNGFNYLIAKLQRQEDDKPSYLLCTIMIFSINPETMVNHGIIAQQDAWHFNTAIWYGSAIVRCLGPILLLMPLLEGCKITKKKIIFFGLVCVSLMSRASQALPLIGIISLGYIVVLSLVNFKNHKKWCAGILLFLFLILILIPSVSLDFGTYTKEVFSILFSSKLFMISLLAFICIPFILKDQTLAKISAIFIFMLVFSMVSPLNNFFIHLSTVGFVISRTLTMFSFYIVILAGVFVGIMLSKYLKSKQMGILYGVFACLCGGVYSFSLVSNFGLDVTLNALYSSPKLIPDASIKLSQGLEELFKDYNEKVYVLGPSWINTNGFSHGLGTTLRIESQKIYSIGAIHRYPNMSETSVFSDFDFNKQSVYETFRNKPNLEENKIIMDELLSEYPINVIFDVNIEVSEALQKINNYHLIDTIEAEDKTFYILINDELFNSHSSM